jgi:D-2-hydroxyacid dehydrogenase (NADP+)
MAATVLFCSDAFWDEFGERVVAIDPTVEVVRLIGDEHVMPADVERITIAFYSDDLWPDRTRSFMSVCLRAPRLAWLQSCTAGTDDPVFGRITATGATLTNAAGAAAPSIAQTVLLYLLALSRDFPAVLRAQSARTWQPLPSVDLDGLRLGIVGFGAIGQEVARLASAFGIEVIGMRRRVRGDEGITVWPSERLPELLEWADAIVATTPLTDQTRGMIDAAAFAAMRPGGWFVNVGRGDVVDEAALVDALVSGHLGGAALDVFTTEPLPPESPLWAMPNVIVTPHSSGETDRTRRRSAELFLDNFRRWTTGSPLRNVTA